MNWLNEYKVIRRLTLVWAMWLITTTVTQALAEPDLINGYVVAIVTAVVSILTVVIGFYQTGRL